MSDDNLVGALQKIKAIVDEALGTPRRGARSRKVKIPKAEKAGSEFTTLPQHIIKLRDSNFFKEPRTATEVHAKLQSTYHCAVDRVVMALLRLKNARKLRKTSKTVGKKKLVAYVW